MADNPLTIGGVAVTGEDVAAVLNANPAFANAVRMKALERRVKELEAQVLAAGGAQEVNGAGPHQKGPRVEALEAGRSIGQGRGKQHDKGEGGG